MRGGWRVRTRATLQAERMLMEIADALRLLPVPARGAADPYRRVAEAFRDPVGCSATATAADLLPAPVSRLDEEEQMLKLAYHYSDRTRTHAS